MRQIYRVALLVSALLTMSTCSGDSDSGGKGGGDKEMSAAFMADVNQETRTWSKDAAARFFDEVVKDFARTSEIETFNTSGISKSLCEKIKAFKNQAGSGLDGGPVKNADQALEFAKTSAFDSAVAGLIERALAASESERETLLRALKVEAFPPDGGATKLSGTAALTQAGLLDSNGQLVLPSTEYLGGGPDESYTKYRDWLIKQSPGLLKPANNLTSGIDNALDKCLSQQ